ncbi:MAG: DUF308 domain-containing protein [Clostridia bacterium]|nr:DUF308 domain-containing protein [Clostridia bacterium]
MLEKILKKASWSDIIISLVFVIFGFLLAYHPNEITSAISIILGTIFIVFGVFKLLEYNSNGKTDNYLLGIGAVAVLAGVIIMFCSGIIMSIFRIIVGVWIIYTGIMNLHTVTIWKDYKSRLWLISLIGAIANIIAGIYVLVNSGAILQTIGVVLIVYGVIDIVDRFIFIRKVENYINK